MNHGDSEAVEQRAGEEGRGVKRTFRCIVHVLDVCAARLVGVIVIGIVEAVVL